ncbi:hypothetical protein [Mesorhizobium sp. B2-3-15]|uniref:AbiTii domain-containing protein n=1 Tax=Mesorhizobium sp. B2-3-15 TaxID=2589949 RepID=UPI0011293CC5|nr:hypothetical protein [Mesorhizobium sp. B2-3-15]TPL64104.1 hypothetical protein FJ954_29790 [Mesorhizobium sp. B2-3-15]
MAGLVEEIQRDALNPTIPVSTLLRKVKVAAAKLKLDKVEDWVEHELNGYFGAELPSYRKLYGRAQAFNPYRGWIPIILGSAEENDIISRFDVRESLSSLESTIARSTGHLEMPFPPEIVSLLNRDMGVQFGRMAIHVPISQGQSVVEAVRNLILDWALDLEKAGILGEGFSFNDSERTLAKEAAVTYNINSIGTFAGNMGSGNTAGDISVSVSSTSQILEIVRKIREYVPDLERAGADGPRLKNAVEAIEREVANEKPNDGRVKALLSDAREALVGAAGNLTAEGAMSLIAAAFKLLGS